MLEVSGWSACNGRIQDFLKQLTPSAVLLPSSVVPSLKGIYGPAGAKPEGGHKDDQRAETAQLWRQPDTAGIAQPGEGCRGTTLQLLVFKGGLKVKQLLESAKGEGTIILNQKRLELN